MKKMYKTPILLIPVIIFLVGALLPFVQSSAGVVDDDSSLILSDGLAFGTVFSPIFIFIIIALISLALVKRTEPLTNSIGNAMYLIAMIDAFFILVVLRAEYSTALENDVLKYAFGGILGFIGALLGLLFAIIILVTPFVFELLEQFYGPTTIRSSAKNNNKDTFTELRDWKKLYDSEIIAKEEYNKVKDEFLGKLNINKLSSLESITLLKSAQDDGLINEDDFISKKLEILN
ncbi:MAG: hypothetical protein QM489_07845 [Candidatus Izemoplasma sp.]